MELAKTKEEAISLILNEIGDQRLVVKAKSNTAKESGLDYCVTCGRCKKHCPVGIDVPQLIKKLRQEYGAKFLEPHLEGAYQFIDSHLRLIFGTLRLELLALISSVLRLAEGDER